MHAAAELSRRATTLHTIADRARQIGQLMGTANDGHVDLIARRIDVHTLIAVTYKACHTRHEVAVVDALVGYVADEDVAMIRRYAQYLEDAAAIAAITAATATN